MNYKKMLFKNQTVFVEVDSNGKPVVKNNRAVMKYNLDDSMSYNPSVANLAELAGEEENKIKAPSKESNTSNVITAYTDGGCIGNPGPAGLGYLIIFPDGTKIKKGEPLGTGTNNIAELTAIYRVLQNVTDKEIPINISTDSTYAIGVLSKGWKAKVNQQLIADIKKLMTEFKKITLIKVKGHAGHLENELVDKLANGAARTQQVQ